MINDTRFWLTTFFKEQEQTKHEYKSFKREIENKFPNQIELVKLKLYETSDSYAEFDCE